MSSPVQMTCQYLTYYPPADNDNAGAAGYSVWKCFPYHPNHMGELVALCAGIFIIVVLAICLGAAAMANDWNVPNPFAPFTRMAERRQVYRHRAKLIKRGMDPDYLAHLERQNAAAIR